MGILFAILTPVPHRKSPDKMEDSQLNLNFRVLGSRTPFCIKKRENITNNFQYIAWDNECPVFLFAKPGKPASISTMGTPVSPRLPGSGLGPSSGGLVILLPPGLGRPWGELAVPVAADTASGCGEQPGWVCVEWGRGTGQWQSQRQENFFLWVPVSSPPQTHHHPGPESLGEGAGTGQIFPLSPQPCNTAHLISPAHPEGNSSSKSCPEFSVRPANSALGVGELLGSGDTSGTPFCIKKREAC